MPVIFPVRTTKKRIFSQSNSIIIYIFIYIYIYRYTYKSMFTYIWIVYLVTPGFFCVGRFAGADLGLLSGISKIPLLLVNFIPPLNSNSLKWDILYSPCPFILVSYKSENWLFECGKTWSTAGNITGPGGPAGGPCPGAGTGPGELTATTLHMTRRIVLTREHINCMILNVYLYI
jgi:hypothetical protein